MPRSKTAKLWQERLRRFDRSRMSVAQFCRNEGVSQPSFYQWKKKLRQSPALLEPESGEPNVHFMPIRLPGLPGDQAGEPGRDVGPATACTTIELPGGIRIRVEVPTDRQPGQRPEARP
ncbi:IS66 family insertion sequence element accessory protein TnpA [Stieleria mannarensis]|uniref:IS66 family insertion sequence element accessory protein TnpA n=1 Tax=Stieleria mannarensis TaxID=2755585 RepID=UPI003F51093B